MKIKLSIIIPCLNEEKTIGLCIDKAHQFFRRNHIAGEVIVSDNGSLDRSAAIASAHGATVTYVSQRGYGAALQGGVRHARGSYIIIGDADNSYDFSDIAVIVAKLMAGYELVVGSRLKGRIQSGAMPWQHRFIGTPLLSLLSRVLFRSSIRDVNSGLRGFTKKAWKIMNLQTTGMEYASEMIVKATHEGFRMCEVPIAYYKDARNRSSKLNPVKDGFRHIIFMVFYWYRQTFSVF